MTKKQLLERIRSVERRIQQSRQEWLLDNRRLIDSHILSLRESLPGSIRKLGDRADEIARELAGMPRQPLTLASVRDALRDKQRMCTLELRELWALDSLLRLSLLERLAAGLEQDDGSESPVMALESLRMLGAASWRDLVEDTLVFERTLRDDPAGVYERMDFATRDWYRGEVEGLARCSKKSEGEVAQIVVDLARGAPADDLRARHIGYYLVGNGRGRLEEALRYRAPLAERFRRILTRFPNFFYLGGIFAVTLAIVGLGAWALDPVPWWGLLLMLIPASDTAIAIVNQIIPMLIPPRRLPRLDFSDGIPPDCATMVVVPTLLLSESGVRSLLEDLEVRALGNPDPRLTFALLTDFRDAKKPTDERDYLLAMCADGIRELNRRHARQPFYLFHRPREWNPGEAAWMGRERKRGKLIHFNRLLQGEEDTFSTKVGDLSILPRIKYVITLDTDTKLPRDTAQKMVGTIAHPLNQARLDPATNTVTAGYGILQPRVSVSIDSARRTLLARIYSGQTGIDPYTTAVSDVYQDLYGEGSYTGKGIYDVAAFQAAVSKRFPSNSLLSHDLIEGAYARAGLLSDVEVIDDYPSHFQAYSKRKHRWTRGDWQIMLWLLPWVPHYDGGWQRNPLPLVARWKILDNLRRSVSEISLMALLLAGWFALPASPGAWTLAVVFLLLLPAYTDLLKALLRIPNWRMWRPYFRDVGGNFVLGHTNALLTMLFLPQQATLMADAIARALARRLVTGMKLLEWESMAQTEQGGADMVGAYLWVGPALGLYCMLLLDILAPRELAPVIFAIGPWLVSPLVAAWLNRPILPPERLVPEDRAFLRGVALRTWRYFTDTATEADHWLVPDNVQEYPPLVTRRTSPTNLGLQVAAQLSAYDFGYVAASEFAARTGYLLHSLEQMERFRGHLFNWYDTQTLDKAQPFLISTVDSGNLATALLAVKHGALEVTRSPVLHAALLEGFRDHLALFRDSLPHRCRSATLVRRIVQLDAAFSPPPSHLFLWREMLLHGRSLLNQLQNCWQETLSGSVPDCATDIDESAYWLNACEARMEVLEQEVLQSAPWLAAEFDLYIRLYPATPSIEGLFRLFARIPTWEEMPDHLVRVQDEIDRVLDRRAGLPEGFYNALTALRPRLAPAGERAEGAVRTLRSIADRCSRFVADMDFAFLLDPARKLLRIGWDAASGQPEKSCYDLLASEARLAAFLAVAKGHAPTESWFLLGRTLTNAYGERVLLSWTGTMFEYLMPVLFQRAYEGTLLRHSMEAAVASQRKYAHRQSIPWGISESAYALRDSSGQYQYQAFGVPALGLKRGLNEHLVIAPYACALALSVEPHSAAENLRRIAERQWIGRYGFYEAIDFTPGRMDELERRHVVRSWMAHHQGMTLLAIGNALHGDKMQDRFHADPLVQATELLLQERLPAAALATPQVVETSAIAS